LEVASNLCIKDSNTADSALHTGEITIAERRSQFLDFERQSFFFFFGLDYPLAELLIMRPLTEEETKTLFEKLAK
jgi:hypothetical protein